MKVLKTNVNDAKATERMRDEMQRMQKKACENNATTVQLISANNAITLQLKTQSTRTLRIFDLANVGICN